MPTVSVKKILIILAALATFGLYQNCAEEFDAGAYSSGSNGGTNTPPPPPPPTPDAVVSVGYRFSCILKNNIVSCWGLNTNGQLGDATQVTRSAPASVNFTSVGNPTIRQVSAGKNHTCAVSSTGEIYCWGSNNFAQLGVNLTPAQLSQSLVPMRVATPAGVVFTKVVAGQFFSCALANTGFVYCWGTDQAGQLGSNLAATQSIVPILVANVANAVDLAAGYSGSATAAEANTANYGRACAVTNTGLVYCWGAFYNTANNLTSAFVPVVISGIANAKAVSVSTNFVCALRTSNDVQCFGRNNFGQLGIGTASNTSSISGGALVTNLSNVQSLSSGEDHACAIHSGGLLSCWGRNHTLANTLSGQLGQDPTQLQISATPLLLVSQTGVEFVASGDAHTCIGLTSGRARCYGSNLNSQLGYTPPQGQPAPNYIFNPTDVPLP